MNEVNNQHKQTPWQYTKLTQIYNHCLSQEHHPTLYSCAFGHFYIYCPDCDTFYRLQASKVQYCPGKDWTGAKPPISS